MPRSKTRDLSAQALDNEGQYNAAQATYDMETKAQVPEDYQKAELDVAQTKAQLDLQSRSSASRKKLLDEGAISGHDYDTAAAALVAAQAAYDVASHRLHRCSRSAVKPAFSRRRVSSPPPKANT